MASRRNNATGREVVRGEARRFARDVFDRLLNVADAHGTSDLTRHRLREYFALCTQDSPCLPVSRAGEGAEPTIRHATLRRHLAAEYVVQPGPTAGDELFDPAAFPDSTEDWEKAYRCFHPGGGGTNKWETPDARPCSQEILESNPGWVRTSGQLSTWEHYVDRVKKRNETEIDARLRDTHCPRTPSGWGLSILQRWNSYTPAMAASEGGGYFVYSVDKRGPASSTEPQVDTGLVIDPGYGFIKNFLSEGFGIPDVTGIAVTHDHPDHLADFQALANLVFEHVHDRSGSNDGRRGITAALSPDSFQRLAPMIASASDVFVDTVVLSSSPKITERSGASIGSFSVSANLALHDNGSFHVAGAGRDSIGITVTSSHVGDFAIGFPSDTKYRADIVDSYAHCDVVCLHLGGLTPRHFVIADYYLDAKTDWLVLANKNHLYLPGVLWFLDDLSERAIEANTDRLVVLSEFGEELSRGLRLHISRSLQAHARARSRGLVSVVPGDVGLLIDPEDRSIRCSCCVEFYPWSTHFLYEVCGESESISYVCPSCAADLSLEQRRAIVKSRRVWPARAVGFR